MEEESADVFGQVLMFHPWILPADRRPEMIDLARAQSLFIESQERTLIYEQTTCTAPAAFSTAFSAYRKELADCPDGLVRQRVLSLISAFPVFHCNFLVERSVSSRRERGILPNHCRHVQKKPRRQWRCRNSSCAFGRRCATNSTCLRDRVTWLLVFAKGFPTGGKARDSVPA